MKNILLILLLFLSIKSTGQKIDEVEIDKFTGKKRINTELITLKGGLSQHVEMKIRTVDSSIFIAFRGTWGIGTVGISDATIFLFEDKTTLSIFPTSIQSYNIEVCNYCTNWYYQQYQTSKADLKILMDKSIISIRRYYSDNYADTDVKEKNAKKVKGLASLVLNEMNK